jgi:hypothetical protein
MFSKHCLVRYDMPQRHTTCERTIPRIHILREREHEPQQKTNSKGKNDPDLPRNHRVASCATVNTSAAFHCSRLPPCTQLRHHSNASERHFLDRSPPITITADITTTVTTKPNDPAHSQPLDRALRPQIVRYLDTLHERRHVCLLTHPSHGVGSGVGGEDVCEL